eukprot:8863-Chlamydomonas_euryale.AAC.2
MQRHAKPYRAMQGYAEVCQSMQSHAVPCKAVQSHAVKSQVMRCLTKGCLMPSCHAMWCAVQNARDAKVLALQMEVELAKYAADAAQQLQQPCVLPGDAPAGSAAGAGRQTAVGLLHTDRFLAPELLFNPSLSEDCALCTSLPHAVDEAVQVWENVWKVWVCREDRATLWGYSSGPIPSDLQRSTQIPRPPISLALIKPGDRRGRAETFGDSF